MGGRDHESHGIPSHRGGTQGSPRGNRVWGILPTVCYIPRGGSGYGDHEEGTQGRFQDLRQGRTRLTTETLRGLISELLAPLSNEELEGILEELDEDGSGSMDFDEFCEMMMKKPE